MKKLILFSIFLASPAFAQEESRVKVDVSAGISRSDQETTDPFARIGINFPLTTWTCGDESWDCSPRINLRIDLSGVSGQVVDISSPDSFRAVDFSGGLGQKFSQSVFLSLYCEAGAQKILGAEASFVHAGCGIAFDQSQRGWMTLLYNTDQRLGGDFRPSISIQGSIDLYRQKPEGRIPEGSKVSFVGQAIFGVFSSTYAPDSPSSQFTVGITVGYGR